ncbi:MAG: Fic family protein [Enterococcus sp.]|nr:Fic family protein [Enterococcus sp.]
MKEFIAFINSDEVLAIHPIIRAMMAHFYIVSIHPFGNGNGRTSRAIESFLFYCYGYSVHGFHSLNNYYYKNYTEYFSMLDKTRLKYQGCLQEFIEFGLKGFLSELEPIKKSVILFTQKKGYQNLVKEYFDYGDITSRQYGLIEYFMTCGQVVKESYILDKNDPMILAFYERVKSKKTIQRDLDKLKELKLIVIGKDKEIIVNYALMKQFTN